MRLLAIIVTSAMLGGCTMKTQADTVPALSGIVSLDLCADQMLLKLVEPNRIKAVSNEASTGLLTVQFMQVTSPLTVDALTVLLMLVPAPALTIAEIVTC